MEITSTELTLASVSTAEMIEKWRQLQEESKKASALGQEANKTRHTNIIQHDVYMQK